MEKTERENTKEKILAAAVKLFAQKGFDGTSVRDICKEADINVCMISYYFGGKKDLYKAIIDNLIEAQTKYAKNFINLDESPLSMSKEEQKDILLMMLDKFVDFFYSTVSSDLIALLLKEQQKKHAQINSPALNYLRKLIAAILNKDENDRTVIYKTLFILSQVNSPRILPAFSLRLLGQDEFFQEDIKIIKDNVKMYVNALLKEAKVD